MRKFFSFLSFVILFSGCATKIELEKYIRKAVLKDENAPKNLKRVKNIVAIEKFKPLNSIYSNLATQTLLDKLYSLSLFENIRVISPYERREFIKLSQIESQADSNKRYYLFEGNILDISVVDDGTYHPPLYTKKGKKIRDAYYSYEVCSKVKIDIYKLPSQKMIFHNIENRCSSEDLRHRNYNIINILKKRALQKAVEKNVVFIKPIFTPIGYIYEIRENSDHDLIAKISIGFKQGLRQEMKVYVYKIVKDRLGGIDKIKVGEGVVSNLIYPNSAWIVLEMEDGYLPKIGYLVEPDFTPSFFDRL